MKHTIDETPKIYIVKQRKHGSIMAVFAVLVYLFGAAYFNAVNVAQESHALLMFAVMMWGTFTACPQVYDITIRDQRGIKVNRSVWPSDLIELVDSGNYEVIRY